MKYILILILAVSTVFTLQAQDNIILKSGAQITGKVIRVGVNVLEYKPSENLEGPINEVPRNQVFMIQYENGTSQVISSYEPQRQLLGLTEPNGRPYKSRGGAIALSVLCSGAGQFYLKSRATGLTMMGTGSIGYLILVYESLSSFSTGPTFNFYSPNQSYTYSSEYKRTSHYRNMVAARTIICLNYVHNLIDIIIRSKRYKEGKNMWGMNKNIRLSPDMVMNADGRLNTGMKLAWSF